jgi:hypothetical protein
MVRMETYEKMKARALAAERLVEELRADNEWQKERFAQHIAATEQDRLDRDTALAKLARIRAMAEGSPHKARFEGITGHDYRLVVLVSDILAILDGEA